MRSFARQIASRTLLAPPWVRHCSQTIYEALLGCCRLWEATGDAQWSGRAGRLVALLKSIQRPDGGFDIGYDFNFGCMHKRGQSTSPELVGLVAYCEYARLWGPESVSDPARRAAVWICERALDLGNGKVAIPYSPDSISEVMVYNGTSFACGALGCYVGTFGRDDGIERLYVGMVRYLDSVLVSTPEMPGRVWPYNDQSRDDLNPLLRGKIDYYHQMQQVEMHALAEQSRPAEYQRTLIRDTADHIVAVHDRHPVIPYTNNRRFFNDQVHLWGLASVTPGMLEAAVVIPERRETYHRVAREVLEWILRHAWNGSHFDAIVEADGRKVEPRQYMVRSDAWVFNAVAAAAKHLGDGPWMGVLEPCYMKMASVDFSGPESHASNTRTRAVHAAIRKLRTVI